LNKTTKAATLYMSGKNSNWDSFGHGTWWSVVISNITQPTLQMSQAVVYLLVWIYCQQAQQPACQW